MRGVTYQRVVKSHRACACRLMGCVVVDKLKLVSLWSLWMCLMTLVSNAWYVTSQQNLAQRLVQNEISTKSKIAKDGLESRVFPNHFRVTKCKTQESHAKTIIPPKVRSDRYPERIGSVNANCGGRRSRLRSGQEDRKWSFFEASRYAT
jgi:hypothetical protein